MKRRPRASPVIKIASPACGVLPDERYARDRCRVGRMGTSASELRPGRAAAAASTR
jgi:hypothetical protein